MNPFTAKSDFKIDVKFYNDAEKKLFGSYSNYSEIEKLTNSQVKVSRADLLTYLFIHKKNGYQSIGFTGFKEIQALIQDGQRLVNLQDSFDLSSETLTVRTGVSPTSEQRERIGEAVGLSAINKLHGLHQADWNVIPISSKRKSFDFEHLAPSKDQWIKVETKGAVRKDNAKLDQLSNAKASIKKKKEEKASPKQDGFPVINYGTIAVLDEANDVRCLLVDPPEENLPLSPYEARVIRRQSYLLSILSDIMPRASLTIALRDRLRVLNEMTNPEELDGLPLALQRSFEIETTPYLPSSTRSQTNLGEGLIQEIGNSGYLIFIGISTTLIDLLISQDFSKISDYTMPSLSRKETIYAAVSKGRFENFSARPKDVVEQGAYTYFSVESNVHHASSGLIFSLIQPPE